MNQIDDFNQPFTYQSSVDFLDSIDDGTSYNRPNNDDALTTNFPDDSASYSDDWTQNYVDYSDDLESFSVNQSPNDRSQSFSLDMYQVGDANGLLSTTTNNYNTGSSPLSPAALSSISSSADSDNSLPAPVVNNINNSTKQEYPNLPTPPPNYVSSSQSMLMPTMAATVNNNTSGAAANDMTSPTSISPGAMSTESANYSYTTKEQNFPIKQESISPPHATTADSGLMASPTSAAAGMMGNVVSPIDSTFTSGGGGAAKTGGKKSAKQQKPATAPKTKSEKVGKPRKEKTSHNMIEKRYRTNINVKIAALRDCVPALRCAVPKNSAGTAAASSEDLEGLTPASKLNKATVLTKATEYINHLQQKNDMLEKQVHELRTRLNNLGNAVVDSSSSNSSVSGYSSGPMDTAPPTTNTDAANNNGGVAFSAYPQQAPYEIKSRLLMGSLAGMMTTGLFADVGGSGNTQGLSAMPIPIPLLGSFVNLPPMLTAIKLMLIIGAIGYIVAPAFYSHTPVRPKTNKKTDIYTTTKMRKQVWDITSKSINMPEVTSSSFTFMAELCYSIFALWFGVIAESSSADRAIDSQLCGGDSQISRPRVFMALVKSLGLQPSAKRYMRNALQCKILFNGSYLYGDFLAKYFWNKARDCDDSELAEHQVSLLHSDVLDSQDIMQRAFNLAMNLPLDHHASTWDGDEAVFGVIRDPSIRSILDVIAAWYACKQLQDVLLCCVEDETVDFQKIEFASKIVPPDSVAHQRVAVVQALLLAKNGEYIKTAMDLLSQDVDEQAFNGTSTAAAAAADCPPLVNERRSIPQDMQLAIHCSFILHFLSSNQESNAITLAKRLAVSSTEEIGLLGYAAIWITGCKLENKVKDVECLASLENLVTSARVWIGSEPGEKTGISLARRRQLVGQCLKMSLHFGRLDDLDEGYGSDS